MEEKRDIRKIMEDLERLYEELGKMHEAHELALSEIKQQIFVTFKYLRNEHPEIVLASEVTSKSDLDPLFETARMLVIQAGAASTSFLQRKLEIGYSRAAKILNELEDAKIIGPARGVRPREVYVTEVAPDVSDILNTIAKQMKKQKKSQARKQPKNPMGKQKKSAGAKRPRRKSAQ